MKKKHIGELLDADGAAHLLSVERGTVYDWGAAPRDPVHPARRGAAPHAALRSRGAPGLPREDGDPRARGAADADAAPGPRAMTDAEWRRLVATPGAQARHQALELLRRPLDAWEAHVPAAMALRRWAVAVVTRETITFPVPPDPSPSRRRAHATRSTDLARSPLHRKIGALTDFEYRLWLGMLVEADDDGRLVADPATLRAKTWPFKGRVSVGQVKTALRALATVGLVQLYTDERGEHFAWFPSWRSWQRPKYPTPSKLPIPPPLPQDSPSVPPGLPQDSPSVPHGVVLGRVVSGHVRDVLGREGSGEGTRLGERLPPDPLRSLSLFRRDRTPARARSGSRRAERC